MYLQCVGVCVWVCARMRVCVWWNECILIPRVCRYKYLSRQKYFVATEMKNHTCGSSCQWQGASCHKLNVLNIKPYFILHTVYTINLFTFILLNLIQSQFNYLCFLFCFLFFQCEICVYNFILMKDKLCRSGWLSSALKMLITWPCLLWRDLKERYVSKVSNDLSDCLFVNLPVPCYY